MVPHSSGADRKEGTVSQAGKKKGAHAAAAGGTMKLAEEVQLIVGLLGIYVFYGIYGIVQERLTTTPFGADGERFTYSVFMVFVQCAVNAVFAAVGLRIARVDLKDAPVKEFAPAAFTYVAAMFCSNTALQFIDYPTQVLTKASKPIPVMVLGALLYRKYYPFRKWLSILLISGGIAVFMFKQSHGESSEGGSVMGYGLLVGSLMFDGLTGPAQEHIQHQHNPSFLTTMLFTNLWATLYMFIEVVWYIALFGITSAMGQFFIYFTLHGFGSLVLTTVTTTRKFFLSMFASILWFGHSLSMQKWIGVILVFSGLGLDMLGRYLWEPQPPVKKKDE